MELIQIIKKYIETLHLEVHSLNAVIFARRLVYGWTFFNYLILSSKAAYFYSEDSYIPKVAFDKLVITDKFFNLLSYSPFNEMYPLFLFLILGFSVLGVLGKSPRTVSAIVYFLLINLDNRASVIMDGGNNLMHLIAFYLIFVNTERAQSSASKVVTNLAVLMIKIQVTFVYATAGLLKVMGPLWNKGVALYYTMGVQEYGNEQLFQFLSQYPFVLAALSLGTVLFQISLPYLIWMKMWRPYIILFGTALHLSITFVMGLTMFGLAMCVSYFFFKQDNDLGFLRRMRCFREV